MHDVERRLFEVLASVPHRILHHPPARTAATIAEARGTPLEMGVKALLLKADGHYLIAALPADGQLHGNLLRRGLRRRRLRFATRDELRSEVGLEPGCVPPFGEPVLPFPLVADPALQHRNELIFTAARHDRSVRLAVHDWITTARPTWVPLSRADRPDPSLTTRPAHRTAPGDPVQREDVYKG